MAVEALILSRPKSTETRFHAGTVYHAVDIHISRSCIAGVDISLLKQNRRGAITTTQASYSGSKRAKMTSWYACFSCSEDERERHISIFGSMKI